MSWLLALTGNLLQPPTPAAGSITGGGTFEATVTLPFFPCSNCGGGVLSGRVGLSLSGVGTRTIDGAPIPYTAVWPTALASLPNLSAAFGYDEACSFAQPPNTPPVIGTAGGSFTVTSGSLLLGGGTISGATLTGAFSWLREGTAAHITLTNLLITASPTTAISLTTVVEGQGAAAVALLPPWGTCINQATNQTMTVAGVALQAV